eukprot:SAG31_NODE_3411_length_4305_cov_2.870185_2_plen_84_part_00
MAYSNMLLNLVRTYGAPAVGRRAARRREASRPRYVYFKITLSGIDIFLVLNLVAVGHTKFSTKLVDRWEILFTIFASREFSTV